jgi:hypothetical protein
MLKRATDRNSGRIEETQRQITHYRYNLAVDLKGYDDSVSIETLDAYREFVIKPVLDALVRNGLLKPYMRNMLMELDYKTQRLPILIPPDRPSIGALLVPTMGGISSGERLTSQKGTDINRIRIDAKMRMLGIKGDSTNQGDDTTVSSDDPTMIEKWMGANDFLGFREEAAPDLSFLMKRMPEGYAYIGRMLMSSIDREPMKEPSSHISAAAAISVRHGLLRGHPLQGQFYHILEACGNTRIRAATAVARIEKTYDLLVLAHRWRMRNEQVESLAEEISEAKGAGLLSPDEATRLEAISDSWLSRFQMQLHEFRKEVMKLSVHDAARFVFKNSYTTIALRRQAA